MMYKYKFVSNLKIDIIVYLHKKRIYPSKKLKTYLLAQFLVCPASVTSICQLIFEARIRPFYSAAIFRWNRALLPPIPTLRRRPVAKGRIVFKTHKLKSFFVDTIGRDKSNAFSLSTKVHLYRMCLETSDALKFCLFFCCFFLFLYVCTTPPRCIRAFSVPAWLESVVDVVYLCDGMGKIIPGSLGNKEEMNVRTTHCSQQAGYTYIVL